MQHAACSSMHCMHQDAERHAINKFIEKCSRDDLQSIVLVNGWDLTPTRVHFGALTEAITPHARYLIKEVDARGRVQWKAVKREIFQAECRRALPRSGVVELMAQEVMLHAISRESTYMAQREILAPVIVQSGSSSSMGSALEKNNFNISTLNSLAEHCYLVLCEAPDMAPSNRRLMAFRGQQLSHRVLYDKTFCSVHKVHRIVVSATGYYQHFNKYYFKVIQIHTLYCCCCCCCCCCCRCCCCCFLLELEDCRYVLVHF